MVGLHAAGNPSFRITVHYLDDLWSLVSVALDFVNSDGKHAGTDIANLFFKVVKEFGLEGKIQGITVDNASANTTFMSELKRLLTNFDPENQHFRCIAHILNLAVQDILKLLKVKFEDGEDFVKSANSDNEHESRENSDDDVADAEQSSSSEEENNQWTDDDSEVENSESSNNYLNESNDDMGAWSDTDFNLDYDAGKKEWGTIVENIRITCKRIKNSQNLCKSLKAFCNASKIKFLKPKIDCPTRWDSTFDMLERVFEIKPALILMWDNCSKLTNIKISEEHWSSLQQVLNFLRNFKYMSKLLSYENRATLPNVVVSCNLLIDMIENVVKNLDERENRTKADECLLIAFQAGRDKILKHYKKFNWVYCVSLILDPRFKLEAFNETAWGK